MDTYSYLNISQYANYYIIDYAISDVTGDGIPDNVYLIGHKSDGQNGIFIDDISIYIQDVITQTITKIPLEFNAGYSPKLFLGNFDNNKVNDILVTIESGGSGGYIFAYIYSFYDRKANKLFDSKEFEKKCQFNVDYLDNYKVYVYNEELNVNFILDISYKDDYYLSQIYDNGKLKEETSGYANGLVALYPIDVDRNSTYKTLNKIRIVGIANVDTLGFVQIQCKWKDEKFKSISFEAAVPSFKKIVPQ